MIDYSGWEKYRVIVVTGPQRSGTTIAGKIIAADTGRKYVDEDAFGVYNDDRWVEIVAGKNIVVQCPSMMLHVHDLPHDTLTVVMRRPIAEILRSQERVGWDGYRLELGRYGMLRMDGLNACEVKYAHWDAHKHEGPKRWVEVEYGSLKDHPLWLPASKRGKFTARQTA